MKIQPSDFSWEATRTGKSLAVSFHDYNYPELSSCFLRQEIGCWGAPCAPDSVTTYHLCAPSWTADFQPPADRVLCVKCPSARGACSVSLQDRKYRGVNTSSPPLKGSSQPMTARNSPII